MPAAPFACAGCGAEYPAPLRWPATAPNDGSCPACGAVLIRGELAVLEEGEAAEEVAYDLEAWDPGDKERLTTLLGDRGIRHRWDGSDRVSVAVIDEGPVDALCDLIEAGVAEGVGSANAEPVIEAVSDSEVWRRLDALAAACRKAVDGESLSDITAAELDEAATSVASSPAPAEADEELWADVVSANAALLEAVSADELDDDVVVERAQAVLDLLPE